MTAHSRILPSSTFRTERREKRSCTEVALHYRLIDGDREFQGFKLSARSLTVWRPDGQVPSQPVSERVVSIRVPLADFDLTVDICVIEIVGDAVGNEVVQFSIVETEGRAVFALRQLVRLTLPGVLPSLSEVSEGLDDETPDTVQKAQSSPSRRTQAFHIIVLMASLLALALFAKSLVAGLVKSATRVESLSAAVVAPRTELVSLASGRISPHQLTAGTAVARDQSILQIESPDIAAEITTATAKIAYLEALLAIEPLPVGLSAPVSLSLQSDAESSTEGQSRETLRLAQSFERGILAALDLKKAGLQIYAPCNCTVIWIAEPGTTVAPGTRVATLTHREAEDLRIWASFPEQDAATLYVGQAASVSFAGLGASLQATVDALHVNPELLPLAGLPSAAGRRSGDISALLRLTDLPQGLEIGATAEVVIRK